MGASRPISRGDFCNQFHENYFVLRSGAEHAVIRACSSGGGSMTHARDAGHWTYLSNHGHVLVCLAQDSAARLRDVAARVGITERAVQKIVADLEAAEVLQRERTGRRNRYRIFGDRPLRHPVEAHRTVGELLAMVVDQAAFESEPVQNQRKRA